MIAYLYELVVATNSALRFFLEKLIILLIILGLRQIVSSFNHGVFQEYNKGLKKAQMNDALKAPRGGKKGT